jgi:acyl carrier protein
MIVLEKYKKVFIESLSIEEKDFSEEMKYNDIPEWDSIGHMTLMSALEDEFKITLETDDIIDFSSYKKGIELLSSKYEIKF